MEGRWEDRNRLPIQRKGVFLVSLLSAVLNMSADRVTIRGDWLQLPWGSTLGQNFAY